jgi:hypothetical protein
MGFVKGVYEALIHRGLRCGATAAVFETRRVTFVLGGVGRVPVVPEYKADRRWNPLQHYAPAPPPGFRVVEIGMMGRTLIGSREGAAAEP